MAKTRRKSRPKVRFQPFDALSLAPHRHVIHTNYCVDDGGNVSLRNLVMRTEDTSVPLLPAQYPDEDTVFSQEWDTVPEIQECPESLPADEDNERTEESAFDLPASKRKRFTSNHPLLAWLESRDMFSTELLRLEGRGDYACQDYCPTCRLGGAVYRCSDCVTCELFCSSCTIKNHQLNPLHCIKKWNGVYFEPCTLNSLGLRIQLGHQNGEQCLLPISKNDFVVVDSHGIHVVALDFCGCQTAQTPVRQLLRFRWFPATVAAPATAATFCVLEQFQLLSFESKVSAYEFYHSIACRADNTGLTDLKDRYSSFRRMVHEWRHLKINLTPPGSCAVICPACLQPGRNAPKDFSVVPPSERWLYATFFSMDADFRMKRKDVSSDEADPGLNNGSAYFMEEKAYKQWLGHSKDEVQEKSECTGHTAVNLADVKSSKGLAATGIGTVDCARHGFKLPNAVGDLQKGERYVNMDYLFFSVFRNVATNRIFVSYDIACQWSKKLWSRMSKLPLDMHADYTSKRITFVVPKFHLNAHKTSCQVAYSLNLLPGVGRTDGEGVERGWANINPAASSTKQMGPGSWRDTLDDYFGDWNWKKVIGLGLLLLRKIKEAIAESAAHQNALNELESAIPIDRLESWRAEVMAWEEDANQPNPFESRVEGSNISLHETVSLVLLITLGLDLEEQQRKLASEASDLAVDATDNQKRKVQEAKNGLQRRIDGWTEVQLLYMPGVARIFKLWLPSQAARRANVDARLCRYEWRLRCALGLEALEEIRKYLHLRAYLVTFNRSNIRGQGANTRAQNTLKGINGRIQRSKVKYRAARGALNALAPILGQVGWDTTFHVLNDDDVRAAEDPSATLASASEGRRKLSWIYTTAGASDSGDAGMQDYTLVDISATATNGGDYEIDIA
ncbi:hypothetical protein EV363DRAFT_1397923 [Boletus edulis]|nr:hypothetical protein EV363DRAFT_1397923 [Boletus edulis]